MPPVDFTQKVERRKKLSSCWRGQFTVWFQEEDLEEVYVWPCCTSTTIYVIVVASDLETEFSPCLFSMKHFLMTRVDRGGNIRQDGTNNDSLGFLCVC